MRLAIRLLAIVALILGLSFLIYAGYQLWGTDMIANSQNDRDTTQVEQQWSEQRAEDPSTTTLTKNDKVLIKIPKFGAKYKWVVQDGVTVDDLHHGPGHYEGSGGLGELGNYAIAGHRTTYGAPFNRIGELVKGDEVRFETWNKIYIYSVTTKSVVDPTDVFVLDETADATLTLTTCHPEFSSSERLIVKGVLTSIINK